MVSSYNIRIFDENGAEVKNITTTSNETRINGLSKGNYTVKVTSPQVVGCEFNGSFEIKKLNKMTMTATFKDLNSVIQQPLNLKQKEEKLLIVSSYGR